jgi:hypothetical protein
MPLEQIVSEQMLWAQKRWPGHTGIRAPSLNDNLFIPMDSDVRAQFDGGSGGETGSTKRPGKMHSLRSSSALAYNFFAPWRGSDLAPLAAALRQRIDEPPISFERQFPHGLLKANRAPSTPPNIDVAIGGLRPLAIESKFTEPYDGQKATKPLDPKYFAGERRRWEEVGLPRCQAIAQSIGTQLHFQRLDVAQLLKHLLGLAYTTKATPRLLCLWFDSGCEVAQIHREELRKFSELLDDSVEFAALTYQEAFAVLLQGAEPWPGHFQYLSDRYFDI